MKPQRITCPEYKGTGEGLEIQIGGDGYDGRCCALADVPSLCQACWGKGYVVKGGQSGKTYH